MNKGVLVIVILIVLFCGGFIVFTVLNNNEEDKNDINTEIYLNNKKLKAKFKYADKLEIPFVAVIGEDEIEKQVVKIKEMKTGKESEVKIEKLDSMRISLILKGGHLFGTLDD